MPGKHCKLYDEQLVKSIMVSTAFYILDYLKGNPILSEQEVYDFVQRNADSVIQYTVDEIHDEPAAPDVGPEGPTLPETGWERELPPEE
ncbi:MAG: hypothetical protein PHC61_12400 [Chitinivibrionales bacterium]|nr:hypothetical protein [Chitinivibrionales bacterium]